MPDKRSARRACSSSVIDIVIRIPPHRGPRRRIHGVLIPKRLVLLRRADARTRLRERGGLGGHAGGFGTPHECRLDGGVRHAVGGEQARTHRFNVGARIGARQTREAMERPLPGTPDAREQDLRQRRRLWTDLGRAREHARRLSRGIEQAIGFRHDEGPFAQCLRMTAQHHAGAIQDLNGLRVHADRDHTRQRCFPGCVVRALDLHEPRIIDGADALREVAKPLER